MAMADAGEAAERNGRHLRMLAELAEIGMELAREVRRQALEEAGAEGVSRSTEAPADWGLVFARIARAVRQTVALEARLAAEAEKQGAAAETGRRSARLAQDRQQKERVRRLVETAIASEANGEAAENLRLDLDERLEDPDIEAEFGRRPIGVIVVGICADLGVTVDLSGFTDAELGFDITPSRPVGGPIGGPDGKSGAVSGVASSGAGADPDPCIEPVADAGSAPAAGPQTAGPARVRSGRDPP